MVRCNGCGKHLPKERAEEHFLDATSIGRPVRAFEMGWFCPGCKEAERQWRIAGYPIDQPEIKQGELL